MKECEREKENKRVWGMMKNIRNRTEWREKGKGNLNKGDLGKEVEDWRWDVSWVLECSDYLSWLTVETEKDWEIEALEERERSEEDEEGRGRTNSWSLW